MNSQAVFAKHTGMIILGGGIVKHHICNANLMVCGYVLHKSWRYCVLFLHDLFVDHIIQTLQRNGADFAVYVNTGQEFDGSDSGARPDEAVSWGKIKREATPAKVQNKKI